MKKENIADDRFYCLPFSKLDYEGQPLFLTEQVRVVAIGSLPLPCATTAVTGREGTHPDPAKKASVDEGAMIRAAAERRRNLIADANDTRRSRCKGARTVVCQPSVCQRAPRVCISVDLCLVTLSSWLRVVVVSPSENVRTSTCFSTGELHLHGRRWVLGSANPENAAHVAV